MSGKRIAGIVMIAFGILGHDSGWGPSTWAGLLVCLSNGYVGGVVMNLVLIAAGGLAFLPDGQGSPRGAAGFGEGPLLRVIGLILGLGAVVFLYAANRSESDIDFLPVVVPLMVVGIAVYAFKSGTKG